MSENALNLGLSPLSGSTRGRVTYEDVLRARDRLKVLKTRAAKSSLRLLWLLAGPASWSYWGKRRSHYKANVR